MRPDRPITDDDMHASLASGFLRSVTISTGLIGSPVPASVPETEDSSSSGVDAASNAVSPHAGAADHPFNLDACMKMGEGA